MTPEQRSDTFAVHAETASVLAYQVNTLLAGATTAETDALLRASNLLTMAAETLRGLAARPV